MKNHQRERQQADCKAAAISAAVLQHHCHLLLPPLALHRLQLGLAEMKGSTELSIIEEERIAFFTCVILNKVPGQTPNCPCNGRGGVALSSCQSAVSGCHSDSLAKLANVSLPHFTGHYFSLSLSLTMTLSGHLTCLQPSAFSTVFHTGCHVSSLLPWCTFAPTCDCVTVPQLNRPWVVICGSCWMKVWLWSVARGHLQAPYGGMLADCRKRQRRLWQSRLQN